MNNQEELIISLKPNEDQLRLLNSLTPKKGRYQQTVDTNGNNLWFYWLENENCLNLFKVWQNKLNTVDIYASNSKKESLLYKILLKNKEEVFNFVQENYDINNFSEDENIWIENNIHAAVWSGNMNLLSYFLENNEKYNIDQKNIDGMTPLMIATHTNKDIVNLLLMSGADPNITDNKKKTALHYAADNVDTDIYTLIEDCGGYSDLKDCLERTPEDIMQKSIEKDEIKIKSYENFWLKQLEKRKQL